MAQCIDKPAEYCHWGATAQGVMDSAAVRQIREDLALVEQDLKDTSVKDNSQ